ncbi:ABC transporter substrate-binding protein [Nonomuraea mangrovi]|uniref:ABC transporter substrate-binding protein n=1 Tax=Nonomuraea mangrovi TaxID=2316207 RepID=A0ABW4SLJ6_9ACTN
MRLPRPPALIAAATLLAVSSCGIGGAARQTPVTLTVAAGGEPADGWITTWVAPAFQRAGVKVVLLPGGDAEQYRTKIARDLQSRRGADVITLDGLWIGELARSGRLRPLTDVAGPAADWWEGWSHIPQAVQGLGQFDGRRYGLPLGADARVLYYNRNLFRQAGLPLDWQPGSWQDILDAGAALKKLPGVTPVQIDAGTAMGEATTMNGVLPLLAGTGSEIYARGKWTGASTAMKEVLAFYRQIYTTGLGDPRLQQEPDGRGRSFAAFADGRIGILAESDSFWRSVPS